VTAGRAWSRAGLVLGGVLVADQLTKLLVRDGIARGDEDPILPGLKLVHVKNDGVAFGIALVALVVYFARHADRPLMWLPTGLLVGGALGNILDRLRDGAVTDFLKLPAWPAFNLADVAITAGVLALAYVLERRADGHPRPA